MPARYVKPYVQRGKSDALDAEAICEAVSRPTMRFATIKTTEQQAVLTLHRAREILVKQQTMLANLLRGCLGEFGIVAPVGRLTLSAEAIVQDSGESDAIAPSAGECAIADLPAETLLFLLGSRYCETDLLSETAWALFGNTPRGWARVQAICDFVHDRISFGYEHANATKTALQVFEERREARLRQARDWFFKNYFADTWNEAMRLTGPGTEGGQGRYRDPIPGRFR